MNTIIIQPKALSQEKEGAGCLIELCHRLNLIPIPLKPGSKEPLVKWSADHWAGSTVELKMWLADPTINWGVRCGENLAALDFDSEEEYLNFTATNKLPLNCPVVKTRRGYHVWVKPRKPIRSQRVNGVELKCIGSYVVAPPSIHPSGSSYVFKVAPNGSLPVVDLEVLLSLPIGQDRYYPSSAGNDQIGTPSDFALRYGKSPYPPSLCGLATKVLTRSDGRVKKLISLRCWKWHCRKCAPLLQRYWLNKLGSISFRFILRLPTRAKPTSFLRRIGKPNYVHIVVNGESWLFITGGDRESVWKEACRAGYELIAGNINSGPSGEEVREYLEKALCLEKEPLNTRRKVIHSRGLFRELSNNNSCNESIKKDECVEEKNSMSTALEKRPPVWESEVIMKPIEDIAKELQAEGWRILWTSEVEAIAILDDGPQAQDIVKLIDMLGVKLKKVGQEYKGLCPFHRDNEPSLSVNRGKGLWYCFGCGRGGDGSTFIEEMGSISSGVNK